MATVKFTGNGTKNLGIDARSTVGYMVLMYTGGLGGGTLRVFTKPLDAATAVPLADAKLSAAVVDDNGDVVRQMTFMSAGQVSVELTGSTGTLDLEVSVL